MSIREGILPPGSILTSAGMAAAPLSTCPSGATRWKELCLLEAGTPSRIPSASALASEIGAILRRESRTPTTRLNLEQGPQSAS